MDIPPWWLNGNQFTMIWPDLTRALGGNIRASAVLGRIHFRLIGPHAYERDGKMWVRLSQESLADEIGLSVDQVNRAMRVLISEQCVIAAEHRLDGTTDRTLSYAINYLSSSDAEPQTQSGPQDARRSESAESRSRVRTTRGDRGIADSGVRGIAESPSMRSREEEEPAESRPGRARNGNWR